MTITDIPLHIDTDTIELTESGAKAVLGLLEKRELSKDQYALRLFISGGGCSGFQYGMALEGEQRDTDFKFQHHGVNVVVDEVSIDYLRGARIDYVEDIMGSGFKIENPNAVAACGCGSSFRTKDSGEGPESGHGCGH
ncbi:MAG TPA: iron-sulfur cluster insertion protein ErpA [Anaerolineales bacterium]|nr:iron-sulfur cluster insertion protein ErpA [Anaerolineales bacterium]